MSDDPRAGTPAQPADLVDVEALLRAYEERQPDPTRPEERVAFGTSGHRGTSLTGSFNEHHILAIAQAICDWRRKESITGPLFLGKDTHALSRPAEDTALEVFAANDVTTVVQVRDGVAPTPVISREILVWNRGRTTEPADGVVVTPSHNPPTDGGFKYNPPHGGPADAATTAWIQARANTLLESGLRDVRRMDARAARRASSTIEKDYVSAYVGDLPSAIDFDVLAGSGLRIGIDPLGGAALPYVAALADAPGLDIEVVNERLDPRFGFMTLDHDGRIRMDCSSRYAMASLIGLKDRFDVAFGTDPDADRHGIVTPSQGLLDPNHYLAVAIRYLLLQRARWPRTAKVGKTLVSSAVIDRVAASLGREIYEVPVGFKWFAEGLAGGALAFGGEESAGASFLRLDGTPWTTDKDGILLGLLAAEITARSGADPGEHFEQIAGTLGRPSYRRVDRPATSAQKRVLAALDASSLDARTLAGDAIEQVLTRAPGNDAPIGGLKVSTRRAWFAARPSGTEAIYKIYAESFVGETHLDVVLGEAAALVDRVLGAADAS